MRIKLHFSCLFIPFLWSINNSQNEIVVNIKMGHIVILSKQSKVGIYYSEI